MSGASARDLLSQSDREREIARGAEIARRNYRLGRSAVAHRKTGLFGWTKDHGKAPDPKDFETLPPGVDTAVYIALGIVAQEANARADADQIFTRTTVTPTAEADQ